MNNYANENNVADNFRINNNKTTASKSFEYKAKIIESKPADNSRLNEEVVFPLKYVSNFWRSLDLLLINFAIKLDLSCSRNCILSAISTTHEVPPNPAGVPPTDCVPLITKTSSITPNVTSLLSLCL